MACICKLLTCICIQGPFFSSKHSIRCASRLKINTSHKYPFNADMVISFGAFPQSEGGWHPNTSSPHEVWKLEVGGRTGHDLESRIPLITAFQGFNLMKSLVAAPRMMPNVMPLLIQSTYPRFLFDMRYWRFKATISPVFQIYVLQFHRGVVKY